MTKKHEQYKFQNQYWIFFQRFNQIELKNFISIFFTGIILLYALSRFINHSVNDITQIFLGIGIVYILIKNPDNFRKDPMITLFFCIIGVQLLTWASVEFVHPEIINNTLKFDKLGKLFLFIPIAWWLKKHPKLIYIVISLALIGFMAGLCIQSNLLTEIKSALNGSRINFGIKNAQHPSMFFGLIAIFCIIFFRSTKNKIILFTLTFFTVISFAGLIFTQTRQSVLALLIGYLFFLMTSIMMERQRIKTILTTICIFFIILMVSFYSININKRSKDIYEMFQNFTKPVPENIVSQGTDSILNYYIQNQKDTSSGIRLQLWLSAIPYILEKPILGWGSKGSSNSIDSSKMLKNKIIDRFGHYHNYHIRTLVCYGLLGFTIINSMYIWLIISSYRIRYRFQQGTTWFLFTLTFTVYWTVINSFEGFNALWPGVFSHNIITGCIYAHYLIYKDKGSANQHWQEKS